jgi:hypothetical protein
MVLGEAAEKKILLPFSSSSYFFLSFGENTAISVTEFHSVFLLHGDCGFSYFTIVS